jgi:sialate O-acetylesterase
MHNNSTSLLITLLTCGLLAHFTSAFQLHGTFSDHMVLQRDHEVRIYGTGQADEQINVEFDGEKASTQLLEDGKWQITFSSRPATATPLTLNVCSELNAVTLNDIVIGDVWVCSGQSNMGWQLGNTLPRPSEFPHADKLRVLNGQLLVSPEHAKDDFVPDRKKSTNGWERATEAHALNISAVSYYMGLEICKQSDVPVGLIVVALGGSNIWPWMTPASINGHPEEKTARSNSASEQAWATGKAVEWRATGETQRAENLLYSYSGKSPSALYNGMLHPLTNMPIAGMLWYQGERSQDNPPPYRSLFPAAIQGWRAAWDQGDFPFIFIQLPGYHGTPGHNELRGRGFPLVREAQELALALPNTGMAMALDYGNYLDVHPKEKHEVGRRAALQALRLSGHELTADGPIREQIILDGNTARIRFSSVADGLETHSIKLARTPRHIASTDPNSFQLPADTLVGFEVCGDDGIFQSAEARIINSDTVEITTDSVDLIHHIRYAFAPFPLCNLYNSVGLPARPFRTDRFEVPYGTKD